MADMLDGFKTMYNDFYGTDDDYAALKRKREQLVRDKVRQVAADINVETEVMTEEAPMKPVAVATGKEAEEPEKPKEPEKSGMEELNELIEGED